MAICLATGGMLAACGGGDSQGPTASDTKLMADGEPCYAAWVSSTAYGGGGKVSRSGRNYTANWWTQGNDPVTSSGPAGSGQPWLPGYLCGGTTTTTKASTTTTKASTTTTKASTTTTKASTTTTKASTTTTGTGTTTTTKATTTTTAVSSCPAYVAGTAYASGKTVTNAGGYYTCDVGGWCSSGASAYEPGVGWAWTSAWHSVSASACPGGTTSTTSATTTTTKASTTTTGTGTTTTTKSTTTTTGTGLLPKRALVGYMHASFANGSGYIPMADVSNAWDIIQLSFAEPDSPTSGNLHFNRCPVSECPNVESDAAFLAAIKAKQAAGKKVLISIGGANGQVSLTTTAARDAFVSSISAIIDKWSLDGLDIDFEGHSIYLNNGDRDFKNPTTPVVVNLISALKTLKTRYGSKFVLTMAPETLLLHGGRMFYGSGVWGGADTRNGVYLPVIHAVRDFLTIVHAQHYNSGPVAAANGTYYSAGTIDFNVALSDMMITGFPIEGNAANFWPGLRPDQVGIGLPANGQAAGSGQMSTSDTQKAFDCMIKGTGCGSYKPAQTYPTFRALMTWSVNWDKFNNFEFSNAHRAYFNANP